MNAHQDRSRRRGPLAFACAIVALLSWMIIAAWLVGRVFTDQFAFSQWLWWLPTVCVIPAAALGALCALRPAPRRLARLALWIVVFALVSSWFLFHEHRVLRAAPGVPDHGLRIAHWNMSHPPAGDWADYAAAARSIKADVLILSSFNEFNDVRSLGALPEHSHRFGIFCVVTPLEITAHRPLVNRTDDDIWSYMIELDATETLGRTLSICMVDLPAVDWARPLSVFERSRMDIAARFRALLDRAAAPPPDIVVGDFNMKRGSASIAHIFPDMHHAYDDGGHGYGATFRRDWPVIHIDHTLLTEQWRAARYDLLDPGFGRHLAQRAHIVSAD